MPKPRMTKSEKAFVQRVNAIVFNPPMLINGKRTLNTTTFNAMPQTAQDRYLKLVFSKTY
jgi:hypothetical protein